MKALSKLLLILVDIITINLSVFIAFYIRFDGNIAAVEATPFVMIYIKWMVVITLVKIISLYIARMYEPIWKYASVEEMLLILKATALSTLMFMAMAIFWGLHFPRSLYILTFGIDIAFFCMSRLSMRLMPMLMSVFHRGKLTYKRVLVIGAGEAGSAVVRELKNNRRLKSKPVAIIDDNHQKHGKTISGIGIVGSREDIATIAEKYEIDQIIIAMPSASKATIKELIDLSSNTDCEIKILPGLYEVVDGSIDVNTIRKIEISDLLCREEIVLDFSEMSRSFEGKTVMVTGGGGSIGSELCRQLAHLKPQKIVILDIYENNAFYIENELRELYGKIDIEVIIASVRDRERIFKVVEKIKPHIIFHAAAHKHVPLMENNPCEAIKNNLFGSLNVIEAAKKYGVEKFVLISTDKAVNPTNIMGASKRMTEMLVQAQKNCKTTTFTAVRFGNVLGSNGSVVPIFKKQIEKSGPVTITHPDIIRYFMTIQEASRLVIQASTFAKSGDVFVLDMGEPVKILTLAENMIKLSGLKPYEDIDIVFTGLRPGEKMFEELIINEENAVKTSNEKIFIEKLEYISEAFVNEMIQGFSKVLDDEYAVRELVKKHVKTYKCVE